MGNGALSLFYAFGLRGVAFGGRFLFVIFAARHMEIDSFGRFGFLQGIALVVIAIAGCEAYQVLLRRILTSTKVEANELRRVYGLFIFFGIFFSAFLTIVTLALSSWHSWALFLGVCIVSIEYLGQETYRNLVNESKPTLAVMNIAMRSGAWGIAVPLFDFIGIIPRPWSLEIVLLLWLVGSLCGAAMGLPLWRFYVPWPHLSFAKFREIMIGIVAKASPWILAILGWRFIENGGRFFATWFISDSATGQLTMLAILASVGFAVQKSVIEPFYFPKIVSSDSPLALKSFTTLTIASVIFGAFVSIFCWMSILYTNNLHIDKRDVASFGLLLLTYASFSFSQISHFKLYRNHKDSAIRDAALAGAVMMLVMAPLLSHWWGILGICAATFFSSCVLFGWKWFHANQCECPSLEKRH